MGKNNIKFSDEELEDILKEYGFKKLNGEKYINNCTLFKCECLKTKYRYNIRLDNLQYGYKPLLWSRANSSNLDYNIKLWLNDNNFDGIKYINYEFKDSKSKKLTFVNLKCKCGKTFSVDLTKLVNNYYKFLMCNDCKSKLNVGGIKRSTKSNIKLIEDSGLTVLDKEKIKTVNATTYVDVMDKDGFLGKASVHTLKSVKHFATFSIRLNKKNFIHNANLWLDKNYYKTKCIEIVDLDRAKFICECGKEMILTVKQFRYGKCRCDECSERYSSLENKVMKYLDEHNVEYIPQYKIDDCRDKLPLPFDFYLKDFKTLIEVDGKQHFEICLGDEEDFRIRKLHDSIKDEYCKNHNLPLIRIPYYEFETEAWKTRLMQFV